MNDKARIMHHEQMRFQRLQGKHVEEELSSLDRAIIGGSSVRLDIPVVSVQDLRRLPDLARGWATYVEFTLSRKEISDRQILSAIANETRCLRQRIREISGGEKFNANGTVKR